MEFIEIGVNIGLNFYFEVYMEKGIENKAYHINDIYEKIRDANGSISAAEDDLRYWEKSART